MNKLAILLLALPLSACLSFGAKPPSSLLTLTAEAPPPAGEAQRSNLASTITVGVPTAPQELAASRIPVRSGTTAVAYVKDAQWVERPAQLFARLVSDTVAARTGRMVLSTRQSLQDPGALLNGELRAFGVDADTQEAVVVFDATLVRGAETVFEKRRFEARVPVSEVTAQPVALALNQAANQVAAQVADWVGK
jgi:cholesterol transport system auxiliary component